MPITPAQLKNGIVISESMFGRTFKICVIDGKIVYVSYIEHSYQEYKKNGSNFPIQKFSKKLFMMRSFRSTTAKAHEDHVSKCIEKLSAKYKIVCYK